MLHTFVAYVEDRPGVLTRVASLFRRLNININSLTVGRSERPGLSPRNRAQIFDLAEVFRARIVDLTSESLIIEMTGVESKIEGLIEILREDDGRILEICRSGKMTMRRGHHVSSVVRAMGVAEAAVEEDESAVEGAADEVQ